VLLPSVRFVDNETSPLEDLPPMPEISATARATAGTLMDIEAILFRPEDPFIFTSGRASPVYVDCRKIISFPVARNRLMALAVETIETAIGAGARVLLVEDLATDGGSKLNFVEAIRTAGGRVADTFVIFHYGIFPEGIAALAEHGVKLHALATWWDALALAEERGYLSGPGLSEVRAFLEHPDAWSAAHGGKTSGKTGAETAAGG
jgi:orotate phosphoribosyltransferase